MSSAVQRNIVRDQVAARAQELVHEQLLAQVTQQIRCSVWWRVWLVREPIWDHSWGVIREQIQEQVNHV